MTALWEVRYGAAAAADGNFNDLTANGYYVFVSSALFVDVVTRPERSNCHLKLAKIMTITSQCTVAEHKPAPPAVQTFNAKTLITLSSCTLLLIQIPPIPIIP